MSDWRLKLGDPLGLVLSADARLSALDYVDDQIWEMSLRGGEPRSLAVSTTYGLRARRMQMFPRFKEKGHVVQDPQEFSQPPVLIRFYANLLRLKFSPFPGLDVTSEFWVPESKAIAGRLRIRNNGVTPRSFSTDWVAILNPNEGGLRLAPARIQGVTVLRGHTESIYPVVFLAGGIKAQNSPHPALGLDLDLLPGEERTLAWAQAAKSGHKESFDTARSLAGQNWEAEIARIELTNTAQLKVSTGDPDWDAAFSLGQTAASGLLHSGTEHLPHPSFLLSRMPDLGYSRRGDGTDYDHLWNGQTCLDAWYLASNLLPGSAEQVKGFVRNFLFALAKDGYMDWKPGLAGQRSRIDASPLLVELAWQVYVHTEDQDFLAEVFRDLLTFFLGWFSPYHDRDGDGMPEWDHPMQAGLPDHPQFSPWLPWSQGVNIRTAEGPALAALLYNDCRRLIEIARVLALEETIPPLQAIQERLAATVEDMWDSDLSAYLDRDRDTHAQPPGRDVSRIEGQSQTSFRRRLRRKFDPPARLLTAFRVNSWTGRETILSIRGIDHRGERVEEKLAPDRRFMGQDRAVVTSEHAYRSLTSLVVEDLRVEETIEISTVDFRGQDISQFLPLWAGLPSKARAAAILQGAIQESGGYWRLFGLALRPDQETLEGDARAAASEVSLPWNALVGGGLLAYGKRGKAARLVANLMKGIIHNLKTDGHFRGRVDANSGQGMGEKQALRGLPPLGLFLESLGVRVITPWKVHLEGANPFPWPVEVRYQGLIVHRGKEDTQITFPDGHDVRIKQIEPCIIER